MPEETITITEDVTSGSSSSALPDDIRESIAIGNVKSVAEQSSMLSNLAYANLISNVNLSHSQGSSASGWEQASVGMPEATLLAAEAGVAGCCCC